MTCTRCAATVGPFELTEAGWRCLAHRRHLVLVAPDVSELEALLLASLTQRDDGRLVNATHDALARNACDDVRSGEVWPIEVPE